jgi:hypothetical protein
VPCAASATGHPQMKTATPPSTPEFSGARSASAGMSKKETSSRIGQRAMMVVQRLADRTCTGAASQQHLVRDPPQRLQ